MRTAASRAGRAQATCRVVAKAGYSVQSACGWKQEPKHVSLACQAPGCRLLFYHMRCLVPPLTRGMASS